ncbi:hypothetical protein [Paracoccus sp. S1E-3]|nr:hypothetical protein [Paracoccus sp. S1E-3]
MAFLDDITLTPYSIRLGGQNVGAGDVRADVPEPTQEADQS